MDELLREFLTETGEHLDVVDIELVRFEQNPNNEQILRNIFRLVHTIKGTCGFLALPRLEALTHAAETLMGRFREGLPVTSEAVSLILTTIDRIKDILAELERSQTEPPGTDEDLIGEMEAFFAQHGIDLAGHGYRGDGYRGEPAPGFRKPGEDGLRALDRLFRDAPGPMEPEPAVAAPTGGGRAAAGPGDQGLSVQTSPLAPRPLPPREASLNTPPRAAASGEPAIDGDQRTPRIARIQTIRVTVDTLEHLMTMVSELVLTRNQLLDIARRNDDPAYKVPLQRLSHVTAELQEGIMKTRMQPIGSAWQQLPRVVRDVAADLGKQIDLVMQGSETELDRQVLEIIKDPLIHMVRNAADHGIEAPAERRARGKVDRGTIRVTAFHEGGTISIEISDDGRGLDHADIRRALIDRGIATEADVERMTDAQVARYIFHPGFSTARAITAISGRGVGMDVVKTNVELIGGTVDIYSDEGRGTTFTIKIPLTLAIVAALIVAAGGQRFAIPQMAVLELVRVRAGGAHVIERINGTPVLRLRDCLLPILSLGRVMGLESRETGHPDDGFVVVMEVGRQKFGVLTDGVFHTEEIVVKPMSRMLRQIALFSGSTILGDGAVVLIADPNGLARLVGTTVAERHPLVEVAAPVTVDAEETTTLLVFRAGGSGLKAVPLSLVTRLEEVDTRRIEWIAGRPLMQYRDRLMPLIAASGDTGIKREGTQPIVVFSDGERSMGLVVDEIVDIVEDRLDIELVAERAELIGSAVVRGVATEIVNIGHFMPLAHRDWLRRSAPSTTSVPRTVLLVDDSAFFRDMLTPVLKSAGYHVLVAGGAEEAVAMLETGRTIDILVTDIEMPDRSGFDLVDSIRRDPVLAALPVIALSSYVNPATVERARQLGIVEFVAKFDRVGLLAALSDTLPAVGAAA